MNYYLQLSDSGSTFSGNGTSWFSISNLSFTTSVAVASGSVGRESFGAVSFTIDPSALTATLLALEAAAYNTTTAEIVGYGLANGQQSLFQLDMFKNAYVSGLTMNANGTETVSLGYGDLHQQSYNGLSTTPAASGGWNTATSTADNTNIAAPASFSQIQQSLSPATAPPLVYYVQFRDSSGTALTSPDGKSWFAITATGFGSSTAGAGARINFGDVSFTLAPGQVLPVLLADQPTTVFGQVELAGYTTPSGGTPQLVQDTVFKTAVFTNLATASDGSVAATMFYSAEVDTTYSGQTKTNQRGWDSTQSRVDTTATIAAPKNTLPVAPAAEPASQDYLQLSDSGSTFSGNGTSWFSI
ncbi:MAG TPA: hypothetical protein PK231_13355, partial [Acidocella sp.]|nr:hypothetical protein [Acidocella sp.]